jgi:hypothetical protein
VPAINRESYRIKRTDFASHIGDFKKNKGLEIGLLIFLRLIGESKIGYANSLSYEELTKKYKGSSIFRKWFTPII